MTTDHAAVTLREVQPFDYSVDLARRWILFLDMLRQRANVVLDHEAAGKPPVLAFEYETPLDARSFDPPANYALLRILCVGHDRLEDCCDPDKPPVIVVDPRAGHGPGLGVVSTGFAYFGISIVLKVLDANVYALVDIIVSPIVASTLGYLVFSEVPAKGMVFGGAILLGGGFWPTREMSRGAENRAVHACQCA